VTPDLDELSVTDGIVLATPTSTHAAVIEQALDRGVPVFVEKPMTSHAARARALAEVGQGRLFVMDKWRYHPGIEELRRIRETRELGQPLGMHLHHAGWGNPHADVDILWILLPHCLSMLLEVFGDLPFARYAFAEQLAGDAVGLHAVLGTDPWATIEVSARSPVKRREFRLHCEGGVAWLDDGWADYVQIARSDQIEKRTVSAELPLLRELRAFVDHLGGGPAPRSSAAEGALIVERIAQLRLLAGLPE
jgi:predicted dehydrogenase